MHKRISPILKVFRALHVAVLVLVPASARQVNADGSDEAAGTARTMSVEELRSIPKIDAHAHIMEFGREGEESLVAMLDKHNMKWLDVSTFILGEPGYPEQIELAVRLHGLCPVRFAWTTGLSLEGWNGSDWLTNSLEAVRDGFSKGAVAVKLWKDIGMVLRDPDSSFVMIDDARFGPLFEFVAKEGKTLVAHIGEPLNCWLPLDSMTTEGDRGYFSGHPQYHCYRLP